MVSHQFLQDVKIYDLERKEARISADESWLLHEFGSFWEGDQGFQSPILDGFWGVLREHFLLGQVVWTAKNVREPLVCM